jgi:integrase
MYYIPALILLGAEHGASKKESLSLLWEDIDFEFEGRGLIHLFRTKNGHERTEYLMPRIREALLEWRSHVDYMRHRKKIILVRDDYVFCRLNGQPIKRFDKAFREACRIAGLEDFHFHDLRSTYCSNLLLSGATLKDVCEMIGHHGLSMTNRYAHLPLEHKKKRQ